MFLFYSGFGINESIRNKGINYTKTLFNKSIILLVKFQISLLLYLLENIFILKNKITLKLYLLSAHFRSSLGNSNWLALETTLCFDVGLYFSITKNRIKFNDNFLKIFEFTFFFYLSFTKISNDTSL